MAKNKTPVTENNKKLLEAGELLMADFQNLEEVSKRIERVRSADKKSREVIDFFKQGELNIFDKLPSADGLTLLFCLINATEEEREIIRKNYSDSQSRRAQKPRPKKTVTHAMAFQKEMKKWRREGNRTLENFIDAAIANSLGDGIVLVNASTTLPRTFTAQSDDVSPKTIKFATLQDWWTKAGKKVTRN